MPSSGRLLFYMIYVVFSGRFIRKDIDYWFVHNQACYETSVRSKVTIDLDQREDAGLSLRGIPSCSVAEERILLSALSIAPFQSLPAVTSSGARVAPFLAQKTRRKTS